MAIAIGKTPLSIGVKFEVIWYIFSDLCMLLGDPASAA